MTRIIEPIMSLTPRHSIGKTVLLGAPVAILIAITAGLAFVLSGRRIDIVFAAAYFAPLCVVATVALVFWRGHRWSLWLSIVSLILGVLTIGGALL